MYSKNYECVIFPVEKSLADFSPKMHQKHLAAGLCLDLLGAYSVPQTS